nr:hypothetical protein [Tanacetum cinerariifolium]
MSAKINNMTLHTIGDQTLGANSKQVPNNTKLQKDVIIIESSDDELDIIGPHKRQRLNKYLNVVNNTYENTLANLEDESSGKNENQVTNNENLKKEVIIIDSSDDEVDIVYDESRTTNENLNTEETNTDFDDEQSAIFKRSTKVPHTSLQRKHKFTYIEYSDEEEGDGDASEYKQHEFSLQEEDIDEKEGNMQNYIYPNTWSNINDNDEDGIDLHASLNKYSEEDIDEKEGNMQNYIYPNTWSNINDNDEDGIDLYDSDMYSIRSVSEVDEYDSFVNDGTTDYVTTNDEDSDDFF